MSEKQKSIQRMEALAEHLSYLASAFSHAYGKTHAYERILSALHDTNAVLDYLRSPNKLATR